MKHKDQRWPAAGRLPAADEPALNKKKDEEALIQAVLAGAKGRSGLPPRRTFALRGLESVMACVLMGSTGNTRKDR